MNGLVMAAQLIAGLSILVLLHEFGHFIAARAFKIKVEKFYLFFDAWGFKLFKIKIGDTEYGIGWLPLGGYVKIAGMIDESMDKEALKQEVQPWEFRSKPAWQRLIVMLAGVIMNAIVGIVIFSFLLLHFEKSYLPNSEVKDGIYAFPLAKSVGFQTGDKILSINGKKLERFDDIGSPAIFFGAKLSIERNNKIFDIVLSDNFYKSFKETGKDFFILPINFPFIIDTILPGGGAEKGKMMKDDKIISIDSIDVPSFGNFQEIIGKFAGKTVKLKVMRNNNICILDVPVDKNGKIFVRHKSPYKFKQYSVIEAIAYGYSDAIEILVVNVKGLSKIFQGQVKAKDSLGGPIAIAQIYGATWRWDKFWHITGFLSMVLAFMNILPIPALDGGHVIFLIIEAVSGKKFSDNFMEKAQIVGMIILFALMAFAIGNDIFKLFQ